ncbi:DUF167 family protein [Thiorhodovibrio frisius]|uniref:UPF0235 protein Thi970DRAFT_03495 n=1 Tax=Thiorhodovibrio frisius TaxID=631362 RepID=H8Z7N6_9GAMM|nr:DUF167 family protein [Thiorhodovibrio frisius]EIC19889.1 TIGR00251 family protein [Thiorhodovibrio frisius]WPL20617.1 hypothetical protein Thiofri_00716 [Thiorhodovibrio frisius]
MTWYRWDGEDLTLNLRVQPRARRDGFAEPIGDAVKVQLRAPPVDGRANASLIAFVAKAFGVPRAQVTLLSGEHSRSKRLRIQAPRALPDGIERD